MTGFMQGASTEHCIALNPALTLCQTTPHFYIAHPQQNQSRDMECLSGDVPSIDHYYHRNAAFVSQEHVLKLKCKV